MDAKTYRAGLINGCVLQAYVAPTLLGLTRAEMDKRFVVRQHVATAWRDAAMEQARNLARDTRGQSDE